MATELQLWNQAISSLKVGDRIEDASERSRAAEQCSLFYDTVRDVVFRAAPWTSLKGFKRLASLATQADDTWDASDPPPGWTYAFGLPSDCVRPRYLASWGRFELSVIGDVQVIAAQEETPILVYTRRITDTSRWDADLFQATVFALAAAIAPGLTGNDADLQNMFSLANEKILAARANDANINFNPQDSVPDWITARGSSIAQPSRFIYPYGEFSLQGLTSG